jgi:dihydrofolate reductase
MRKLIVAFFTSLDGVIQAPGGPEEDPTRGFQYGGWGATHWDEAMGAYMGEGFGKPFDLLLGRKTYDIFAAHWPFTEEEPARLFNSITKYVATRQDAPLAWQNSVKLEGDVAEAVARLKQGDGPDLLTQGSSRLVHHLLAAGLVDELSLMTFPILLGHGKRWYDETAKAGAWELRDSRTSTTGVIMSRYQPVGPVQIGDFQLAEPSDAEKARRAKMKLEG